ncbi:MAG: long-chain fatty acid--CoA ligase, partial [Planctomycetota bacterium]
ELIITSGGKNIAPQWIEGLCKQMIPLVSQAVLIGEGRKYVAALFTLEPEALERWCRERGLGALPIEQLVTHPALLETLQRGVDAVNAKLARVEQIKRFHVLPRELSVAAGELTPTMKLKRRVIAERHAEAIEALYRPEPVAAG